MSLERMYDVTEQAQVSFIGYATENERFDLAIMYTDNFFGKPLVICMQTGKSAILSADDLDHVEHLQRSFSIKCREQAEALRAVLQQWLPAISTQEQY
ncbi:DUF3055 domain-containing protein [Paenibacillus sp. MBLB4367]|uniref:DUF3055 domain-containing protein n=1 Tax=Paenibacillus sp. MBLB4367 TaxID=3384767 RepID=UPI0039082B1E